ncbi:hypothetical protein ACLOJK_001643 [Asimina triloba]
MVVLTSCMKIRHNFGGQGKSSRGTSNSVITLAKMRKQRGKAYSKTKEYSGVTLLAPNMRSSLLAVIGIV